MNKNMALAIGTIVVLLLAVVGFALSRKSNNSNPSVTPTANSNQTAGTTQPAEQKSLKDLFASTGPQQCSFNATAGSTGTVYVASGKMRGDFDITTSGTVISSHMISDGKTSYVWMDGQKTGFKMSFDPTSTSPVPSAQSSTSVDVNQKMDYNCSAWSVDQSKFTLPTDITFSDMSQIMAPKTTGTPSDAQCAACDKAPADYKAQCKAALGCK